MSKYDKKYYWLKLQANFFKRHDTRIIEKQHGAEGVMFYLKLLCESLDHNGRLRFSEGVPYIPEMLGMVLESDEKVAKETLESLVNFGMVEVLEDGTFFMTKLQEMTGSETGMAKYMRDRRALESGKELKLGHFSNVSLSKKELDELKQFYPSYWADYIEKLSMHKESTGRTYESDYATLMGWLLDDVGSYEGVEA